jgi:hypothetical protein
MPKLNREEYETQEAYFYHLYNDLGCADLEISYNDGKFWTKWIKFEDLVHLDDEQKVASGLTKKQFIEIANNRSVLDIEILYDFDEGDNKSQKKDDIFAYARKGIARLNAAGIEGEAYYSGSKSIHYSVLVPALRNMSPYDRMKFKERALQPLLNFYKYDGQTNVMFYADAMKKSKRCMIALEGAPHWKTGKLKQRIDL